MSHDPRLEAVPLFSGLPDEDLERLSSGVTEVHLEPGAELFREGDEGTSAYVIVAGEIEIVKQSMQREMLLAVQGPGTVIGEMALLHEAPRMASGRARGPTTLLEIPRSSFDYVLDTSPAAARRTMDVVLERFRQNQAQLQQSERMAQLGTLTAGLAHELNNPAAAVARGAEQLGGGVDRYGSAYAGAAGAIADDQRETFEQVLRGAAQRATRLIDLDPLARSDAEMELEDWLADRNIERAWEMAPSLADLGYAATDLAAIEADFAEATGPIVAALTAAASLAALVREVEEGAERLSTIVRALKSYSYLDQAPVQNVDLTQGLNDTLLILKRKLGDVTVRRDFDANLPMIEAYGSELNQVWTNLIDNAADAIHSAEQPDGVITLRTLAVDDGVVVEVEDNGPGIPSEIQERVFDSFFTTKPPGSGTGLGLDISRSIVMTRHGGMIGVESQPGRTVFRVELPLTPPG
ncbi:MAG: ATP-binding protein [Acidimicrobiia bacterium]|nr:ATP-binding protein [Acidimicrobiia bacterium]